MRVFRLQERLPGFKIKVYRLSYKILMIEAEHQQIVNEDL